MFSFFTFAQQPAASFNLYVHDNLSGWTLIKFGLDPTASDSIDFSLGEEELPPFPPSGIWESRFFLPSGNFNGSLGSYSDYRWATFPFTGQKEYRVAWQRSSGANAVTIVWNLPQGVTGNIRDIITGTIVNKIMSGLDSVTVTSTAITRLKMFINFNNYSPGTTMAQVSLVSPLNQERKVNIPVSFSWNTVQGATQYRIQVAEDSLFLIGLRTDSSQTTSITLSDIKDGTKYYWRVRAENSSSTGPYSEIWSFSTLLFKPDSLVAATAGIKKVTLIWKDRSPNETGFIIERKNGDSLSLSPYNYIGSTSANISTFIDSVGISDTNKYTYRVKAFNLIDSSLYSNQATILTLIPVELETFTYTVNKQNVCFVWETASEKNNAGFSLELFSNNAWRVLEYIPGNGTTTEKTRYEVKITRAKFNNLENRIRLVQKDFNGVETIIATANINLSENLTTYFVLDNFPNPFNPTTTIQIYVPVSGQIKIHILNEVGEMLSQIADDYYEAGLYNFQWNGKGYSTGVYIIQAIYNGVLFTRKLLLLK